MVLEWLRRSDPTLDAALRLYLFSEGSIVDKESEKVEAAETSAGDGSLRIGSLRGDR
jgi:hypothetical protein